ncbi:flagellar hook-associated protein 2 [Clostridium pascui]|uniref:flagellar filament capping protein FliD n=1 Tax=Clostridium pascui TaxID=46609 RepID=UPI00195DCEB0|nr:flagellar filament capping protein FliD [Clostridium pascui]MBM7869456.1 flagellar hook-associated protein 2 [Clostridium pascui]
MSSITSASNKLRVTGMATGIDTDAAIKQMMTAYYARVDKVKQQQQILQWKQEAYRDYIGQINSLKSKYFDVLSKDYILSSNNFSAFQVTPSDVSNTSVSAKAATGAIEGNYKIEVTSESIATKASLTAAKNINVKEATTGLSFPIVIKNVDATNYNDILSVTDKSGVSHNVTITSGTYANLNDLATQINKDMSSIDISGEKKLSDDVKAVVKDGSIKLLKKITIDDTNKNLTIDVNGTTQNITIDNGSYTLEELSSKITSKLTGGYKAQSADGQNITFTDKDNVSVVGTAKFSDNSVIKFDTKVTLGSTGASAEQFSNPTISDSDTLSFDKRIITGVNDTLSFTIFSGGTSSTTISLDGLTAGVYDTDTLISEINNKLQAKSGTEPLLSTISVSKSADGKLLFNSTTSSQITVTGNAAKTLGISSGFKLDQSNSDKMINLIMDSGVDFGSNDYINNNGIDISKVTFTINDKEYLYDFTSATDVTKDGKTYIGAKNKSISDILSDISKGSNVDISYSQLDRKFYMTSKDTGSSQKITITDDNKFIENLFGNATAVDGKDVVVKITQPNGSSNTIIQSSNNFAVDGISYTLNSKPTGEVTFGVKGDNDGTLNKIKEFINSYNELIGKISSVVEEKKQYTYLPLTDDQKEDMGDEQIEKWEVKAKQGILSGDSTLENMLRQMRRAFTDNVEGAGTTFFEIGLNTSSDVSQRGKIIIDEEKLTEALKNDPNKVMSLFIQKSTSESYYSRSMTSDKRKVRYNEEGIFNRLSDIFEDNISTYRDNNGKKGTLLEIAGIKGDFTEFKNTLTNQIEDRKTRIDGMLERIYDKEEAYYKKFAQLETAMNNMNSQSSWLASQLGLS